MAIPPRCREEHCDAHHCHVCSERHAPTGQRTCDGCLDITTWAIKSIAHSATLLIAQAIDGAPGGRRLASGRLPGGEPLLMALPHARNAWELDVDPEIYDEENDQTPGQFFAFWSLFIAEARFEVPAVPAAYLVQHLTWAAEYLPGAAFAVLMAEAKALASRLEALLQTDDARETLPIDCVVCSARLRLVRGLTEAEDRVGCTRCDYDAPAHGIKAAVNAYLSAHPHPAWVILADAAAITGVAENTLRRRIYAGTVASRLSPESGLTQVWWPDIQAWRDGRKKAA